MLPYLILRLLWSENHQRFLIFIQNFSGNLDRAISLFEKALKLAKSEMELTHIFSLKDAAQAQLNVTKKMGLSLQSLMSSMPNFA